MRPLAEEVKAGADHRLIETFDRMSGRVFEQVAGKVLDDELIVGHVVIEGADHVIAIAEGVQDLVVEFVSRRLGVPDQVQPVARPALAVMGAGEQPVHQPLVSIGRLIRLECGDLVRRGGQPDQIVAQPPNQRPPVGFGCGRKTVPGESGQDEPVNGLCAQPCRPAVAGGEIRRIGWKHQKCARAS